jgi:hypothetical protein
VKLLRGKKRRLADSLVLNDLRKTNGGNEDKIILRIFSSFNFNRFNFNRFVDVGKTGAKSKRRLLPEGDANRIWFGSITVMILSFLVLGLSNSPQFRANGFLVLLSVLATALDVGIVFLLGAIVLRNQNLRELQKT